jgi:hypothetical protein
LSAPGVLGPFNRALMVCAGEVSRHFCRPIRRDEDRGVIGPRIEQ